MEFLFALIIAVVAGYVVYRAIGYLAQFIGMALERKAQLGREKEEADHKKHLEELRGDIRELLSGDIYSGPKYEIRNIVKEVIKEQVKKESLKVDERQMGLNVPVGHGGPGYFGGGTYMYDPRWHEGVTGINAVYAADDKAKKKRGKK